MSFNKIIFQREPDTTETVAEPRNYGYVPDSVDDEENEDEEVIQELTTEVATEEIVPVEPIVEIAQEIPVEIKPIEVTPTDWKKAIKTADKYEALKELGYDDFTVNMLKYKDGTGDFIPYLQAKTVDFSKMSDVQLLKMDMQKQNPGMSERALDFKFKKDFETKYYTNRDEYDEDSDEAVFGAEQLRLDSEAKRKQFIEEQEGFKAPEPKADPDASRKAVELEQKQTQLKNFVLESPLTKSLQTAKSISFGEGEESFNYPLKDTQSLIDNALNSVLNASDTELTPENLQRYYAALAIGSDVQGFVKAHAEHYKALGRRKVQDELQNITPKADGVIPVPAVTKNWGYK